MENASKMSNANCTALQTRPTVPVTPGRFKQKSLDYVGCQHKLCKIIYRLGLCLV